MLRQWGVAGRNEMDRSPAPWRCRLSY